MFKLFFPISELYFDPFLILSTGFIGGFLSGFLGIGCGVIITPVLMEFGIPPFTAVSTQLCHAVGTNLSNFLSYNRKKDVDFHLTTYILFGGTIGAFCEWLLLKNSCESKSALTKFIYIYIFILIICGCVMLFQSIKEWNRKDNKKHLSTVAMRRWMLYLPFHKIFIRSRAEMSVLIPIFVGFLAGLLVASLGGGNNLFMAPILTYLVGRITAVVHGTTALSGCFVTAIVALIYSKMGYCCDMLLVLILFLGAGIGSFIGVKLTYGMKRTHINIMAASVMFLMASMQISKLINNSFSEQRHTHSTHHSFLLKLVNESPITYTAICIAIIGITAYVFEKSLQRISEKKNDI